MSPDSALATLAQLGVAIPGFATVISLLVQRGGRFVPAEFVSFMLMLILASTVVVGSLAPFVLVNVIGEEQTWRWCGVGLGTALITFSVGTGIYAIRARNGPAAPRKPWLLWSTGLVPFLLVGFAEVYGWISPSASLYLGGLAFSVCGAGYLFWFTLLYRLRSVIKLSESANGAGEREDLAVP